METTVESLRDPYQGLLVLCFAGKPKFSSNCPTECHPEFPPEFLSELPPALSRRIPNRIPPRILPPNFYPNFCPNFRPNFSPNFRPNFHPNSSKLWARIRIGKYGSRICSRILAEFSRTVAFSTCTKILGKFCPKFFGAGFCSQMQASGGPQASPGIPRREPGGAWGPKGPQERNKGGALQVPAGNKAGLRDP